MPLFSTPTMLTAVPPPVSLPDISRHNLIDATNTKLREYSPVQGEPSLYMRTDGQARKV